MKILTPDKWQSFVLPTNKFNGLEFEKLVGVLLNRRFGGTWKQTAQSWDDAHDYECAFTEGKRWAECKMHKANLSTSHIAKTLVLAINFDVDFILIFSYSRLVKNAVIQLGIFAGRLNKKVVVYDDEKFERLILESLTREQFTYFFPDVAFEEPPSFSGSATILSLKTFFCKDVTVSYSQLGEVDNLNSPEIVNVARKSLNSYELILESNSSNEENIQLDFSQYFDERGNFKHETGVVNLPKLLSTSDYSPMDGNMPEMENVMNLHLLPHEIVSVRLYVCPQLPRLNVLPAIGVKVRKEYFAFDPYRFQVAEITTPAFIGTKLLEKQDELAADADILGRVQLDVVSGKSGVGKTRFIMELIKKLATRNFDIYILSGENFKETKSLYDFIPELLSQLYKLPNLEYLATNQDEKISFVKNNRSDLFDGLNILKSCINDKKIPEKSTLQDVVRMVKRIFLRTKSALFIDDVQFFNEDILAFLRELSDLQGTPGRNLICYVFNTELLSLHSKHFMLYEQLRKRKFSRHTEINVFDKESVRLFIDSIFDMKDPNKFSEYMPDIYERITTHILHRPYFLMQFIMLAMDMNIISFNAGKYFIRNVSGLNKLLTDISEREQDILKMRYNGLKHTEQIVICLLNTFGSMNRLVFVSNGIIKDEDVVNLIKGEFIKDEDGQLIFYHSIMEKYFLDNPEIFSSTISKACIAQTTKNEWLEKEYPMAVYFLTRDSKFLEHAIIQLSSFNLLTDRNKCYASAILSGIYQRKTNPQKYLNHILKVVDFYSCNNKKLCLNTLETIWRLVRGYNIGNDTARAWIEIIWGIGSYHTVFGDFDRSRAILKEGLERLKTLKIDKLLRWELESRLVNRISVSYKQERRLQEAYIETCKCSELAEKAGSIIMRCFAKIDLGYIYLGMENKKDLVHSAWSEMTEIYRCHTAYIWQQDPDAALACLLVSGLLKGIEKKYNECLSLNRELLTRAIEYGSGYYELQARRALIFFKFKARDIDLLQEEIRELLALAERYHLYKYNVFGYHMSALIYEMEHELSHARKQYELLSIELGAHPERYSYLLIEVYLAFQDMLRFIREYNFAPTMNFDLQNRLSELYSRKKNDYPDLENCQFRTGNMYCNIP